MRMGTKICASLCSLFLLFVIAGCGKKEVESGEASSSLKPEGHMIEGAKGSEGDADGSLTAGELEPLDKTGINPLAEDTTSREYQQTYGRSTAPLLPVYFNFDSSSINADQLETLNESGAYLNKKKADLLVIEGNCDERGTADYNLALGELRAINVKKYLVNIGVDGKRIKTISYGSQRPLFHGSDEESWAANRRADLVLP